MLSYTNRVRSAALRFVLAAVSLIAPLATPAQENPDPASCVNSIPRSEYREVPVFLFATVYEDRMRPLLPSADLLSQSAAYRVRRMLGADESDIPAADSMFQWQLADSHVDVVVRRDGKFSARLPFNPTIADTLERAPMSFIRRAIQDSYNDSEWLPWPQSLKGDSAVVTLVLLQPRVAKGGRVIPIEARDPVAVFSLWVPWTVPAIQVSEPKISYPDKSRQKKASGGVPLEYVVGPDGNIVRESIRELWPPDTPRPAGDLAEYYEAFKQAVMRGLPSAKYSPASIGGCLVSQRVVQFFDFQLYRR